MQRIKDNSQTVIYNALLEEKKKMLENKNISQIERVLFHGVLLYNTYIFYMK